ncbi:MAG: hypothetical protein JSV92_01085 [archaeon]|nr:MAG: hypothetical protein JSV92_01085 [archaeon]
MKSRGLFKVNLVMLIALVVGVIIILFLVSNLQLESYSAGATATHKTANELGMAIKEVSNCIDTRGSNCRLEVKARIYLPQANVDRSWWGLGGPTQYPLWTVFHNTKLDGIRYHTDTSDPNSCQEAPPIAKYCSDLWKKGRKTLEQCEDKICYGLIGMADFGSITLEGKDVEKVKPFWVASPCYAEVLVRPSSDPKDTVSEGCVNCIEICYIDGRKSVPSSEWLGKENFCHNDDNKVWPDDYDAWDSVNPVHQHSCS